MPTRREFIHGAASAAGSVAFLSCDLLDARHAHAEGAPRRREVVVSGKAGEDRRHPRALRVPRIPCHGGIEGRSRGARPDRAAHPADGRARHRRRGAQHQSGLVQGRARRRRKADPHAERETGRAVCEASRPLRRFRHRGDAAPGPRRPAARIRREEARAARHVGRHPRRTARSSPTRNSIRSGPSAKSSASWCSCIRWPMARSSRASAAMAGWSTSSAIRSTPRSRSRT